MKEREQRERETARTAFSRFLLLTLGLALVLSTLAFGTVHMWSLAAFQGGAALVLLLWLGDAFRTRRLRLSANFLQLPLLGLFALGLVQLLPLGGAAADATAAAGGLTAPPVRSLSFDPYATRFILVQLGAFVVYFAAALAFIDSPRRLRVAVRTTIIFGFLLALFGLLQYFVSPDRLLGVRETRQAVGFGPFINRHHFATAMVMTAGLPLGLLFSGAVEPDRRLLYAFAALLMGVALVMTNSRGGMLALVAEVAFVVIVSGLVRRPEHEGEGEEEGGEAPGVGGGGRMRGLVVRAAAGAGLVLALLVGVLAFGGEGSLNRLLGTVNSEDPSTGRLHFWRGAVQIIQDHPLVGVGLGAFPAVYPRYDTSDGSIYRLEQAHNDYLQILTDGGAVGGALALLFAGGLFFMALRRMQSESDFRRGVALGALAGCFAALVHSFFDFPLHTASNGLLFLGLAVFATAGPRVEHVSRRRRKRRHHHHRPAEAAAGEVHTDGQDEQDGKS